MFNNQFSNALAEGFRRAARTHLDSVWDVRAASVIETGVGATDASERPAALLKMQGALQGSLYLCPDEAASRGILPPADPSATANEPSGRITLLQSFATEMTQVLSEQYGEVELEVCSVEEIDNDFRPIGNLHVQGEHGAEGTISLFADAELVANLEALGNHTPSPDALAVRGTATSTEGSFERVIDVPLAVSLRFGKRQLTIRELLELNMGSLVELDRQVEEPVDLMLGERLIARGEVVIVDGNYGMRVTEVIEQPTRRTMRTG